jgi:hypothetical protein
VSTAQAQAKPPNLKLAALEASTAAAQAETLKLRVPAELGTMQHLPRKLQYHISSLQLLSACSQVRWARGSTARINTARCTARLALPHWQ